MDNKDRIKMGARAFALMLLLVSTIISSAGAMNYSTTHSKIYLIAGLVNLALGSFVIVKYGIKLHKEGKL